VSFVIYVGLWSSWDGALLTKIWS